MEQLLFALLRSAVSGIPADAATVQMCAPEQLKKVFATAQKHALGHLIGQAVSMLDVPKDHVPQKCEQAAMHALVRYTRMNYDLEQVCALLEAEKIPFIPLKGAVLRAYYPQPWMRTSSDIDILIQRQDLERATGLLEEKLRYCRKGGSSHDVSLYSPAGVQLELHYALIEEYISRPAEQILSKVWQKVIPAEGKVYQQKMPDELFYFYHMVHAQKHLLHGGCGIRPVLDTWVLNRIPEADQKKREALLQKGNLLQFAHAMEKLSRIWFSAEPMDAASQQLQQFVLSGGVFGSVNNRVAISRSRQGGKTKYAISRIFLPYDILKHYYPILQKHRWLIPACQLARWCKLLFRGGVRRSMKELSINASAAPGEERNYAMLLAYLGIV